VGAPPAAPGESGEPRSDADLLAAHAEGDPDAFATLLARHRDRLWGLALRTTGDREDAADALQDALVKAHRAAATFRGESAVTTWLHRIVVNACFDLMRRESVRPATAVEADVLDRAAEHARVRAAGTGDDPAAAAPVRLDVEQALAALPRDQRAAVVLVDVLGHDLVTAADLLGCPVGTVKSRCSRGRARLAALLPHLAPAGNPGATPGVPPSMGGEQP
jgi:RNA polymerase sigma-70 factor (ECF subfamily)